MCEMLEQGETINFKSDYEKYAHEIVAWADFEALLVTRENNDYQQHHL
jgi:hypothetical protein